MQTIWEVQSRTHMLQCSIAGCCTGKNILVDGRTRSRPARVPPAPFAPTSNPNGVPPVTPMPCLHNHNMPRSHTTMIRQTHLTSHCASSSSGDPLQMLPYHQEFDLCCKHMYQPASHECDAPPSGLIMDHNPLSLFGQGPAAFYDIIVPAQYQHMLMSFAGTCK